jgi:hypothetical protein
LVPAGAPAGMARLDNRRQGVGATVNDEANGGMLAACHLVRPPDELPSRWQDSDGQEEHDAGAGELEYSGLR